MEVLQTSALPLGDGADQNDCRRGMLTQVRNVRSPSRVNVLLLEAACDDAREEAHRPLWPAQPTLAERAKTGAGNGIRTRDFDLGKVALYH